MKENRKTALLWLFVVVLVIVGIGVWFVLQRNDGSQKNDMPTAKVVRRDFVSSVLATGIVRPQIGAEVRVGARISGKVEQLHANIGDVVKKGQVIAELEKADLEALEAQRQAELQLAEVQHSSVESLGPVEIQKAEASVRQCNATVSLSMKELQRQEDLLKKDFTSEQARDRAQERLAVAEAQLASAEKSLELAKAKFREDLKQAKSDIERTKAALRYARAELAFATITAPIDGVIASISTQRGETVAAGLNAPTFVTIIDLRRLQVDAYVDEVDIGRVRTGQKALFSVDAFPDREFHGQVTAVYPKAVLQENVVNYDVVIQIAGSYGGLLRPEMTTSVSILLDKRTQILAVPARVVKRDHGKNVVYVMTAEKPERREVKVGWRFDAWIEIVEGLTQDETVLFDVPNKQQEGP